MSRGRKIKFENVRNVTNSLHSKELFPEDAPLSNNTGARLLLALEKQPKPPCVDRGDGKPCEFYYRCGIERLACRSFFAYTREPLERKEYREWLSMEKLPSHEMYEKTYKADVSPP